jgi:hypothetical protein
VRDEGRTIKGLAAIKQWKAETKKKYQHTVEPLESGSERRQDRRYEPGRREFPRQPGQP